MATQRWPRHWLMTDERMGERLDPALERAAACGAGILVRHYRSSAEQRRALAQQVAALGAPLAVARDMLLARDVGALFVHNPAAGPGSLPFSLSIHDEAEAVSAAARGAALVFVSPVYPTRSHPGAPTLGEERALELAQLSGCPAIALGGVDDRRGEGLVTRGFFGWAGIDCWC